MFAADIPGNILFCLYNTFTLLHNLYNNVIFTTLDNIMELLQYSLFLYLNEQCASCTLLEQDTVNR